MVQAITGLAIGNSAKKLAILSIKNVSRRTSLAKVIHAAGNAIGSFAETGSSVEDEVLGTDALVVVICLKRGLAKAICLA